MLVSIADLKTYMDISLTARQEDAAEMIIAGIQSEVEAFLGRPVEQEEFVEDHVIPSYFQGVPATSFFYDSSLDSTGNGMNYIQPSQVIALRNTPVSSVKSVSIRNLAQTETFLGEAMMRTATITNAVVSGQNVLYTANNEFTVGQRIITQGVSPSTLNTSFGEILAATPTSFTVKNESASGAYVSGGNATATGNDYIVHRYGVELYRGFPNDKVRITYLGGLDGDAIKLLKLTILRAATREMQNMHDDVVGVKDLNPRGVSVMDVGLTDRELFAIRGYRRRRIS